MTKYIFWRLCSIAVDCAFYGAIYLAQGPRAANDHLRDRFMERNKPWM